MFSRAKEKRKRQPPTEEFVLSNTEIRLVLRFVLAMAAWIVFTSLLVSDANRENELIEQLRTSGITTWATVTDKSMTRSSRSNSYHVTYEYEIPDAQQVYVSVQLTTQINSEEYGSIFKGDTIPVIYTADAPRLSRSAATVKHWNYNQRLGESALFIVLGGGFLLFLAVPKRWLWP